MALTQAELDELMRWYGSDGTFLPSRNVRIARLWRKTRHRTDMQIRSFLTGL
jgi:hypothetical protein